LDPPGAKVTPLGALARMGLEFCSVPGKLFVPIIRPSVMLIEIVATSTDVERLFSQGGLKVTKHETLRCLMVLASWFKMGLVPVDEVLRHFHEKRTRRGKGNGNERIVDDK
jgi:hypothetical protein